MEVSVDGTCVGYGVGVPDVPVGVALVATGVPVGVAPVVTGVDAGVDGVVVGVEAGVGPGVGIFGVCVETAVGGSGVFELVGNAVVAALGMERGVRGCLSEWWIWCCRHFVGGNQKTSLTGPCTTNLFNSDSLCRNCFYSGLPCPHRFDG